MWVRAQVDKGIQPVWAGEKSFEMQWTETLKKTLENVKNKKNEANKHESLCSCFSVLTGQTFPLWN